MSFHRARILLTATIFLATTACSNSSDYVYTAPASVEEVSDDLWRVTLTEAAATRTGLETEAVATASVDGEERLVIPYSAVIYHYDGTTWTYTNPDALTYLREAIDIEYIEQDRAVLNAGPALGSEVVTVGAAELYGVEFGVGK